MKLKSCNYIYCLLFVLFYFTSLNSEEKIDIWKDNKDKQLIENKLPKNKEDSQKLNLKSIKTIELNQNIKIENQTQEENNKENKNDDIKSSNRRIKVSNATF